MSKPHSLQDLAVKTVIINLHQTLIHRGVELCTKKISQTPLFATEFIVDLEEDLQQLLLKCFLSSSKKVGFCTKYIDKTKCESKVFHVYSNKPSMRYKKRSHVRKVYPDHPYRTLPWEHDWWIDVVDCIIRRDEMFLSSVFPSNINFHLSLLVTIIKVQRSVDLSAYGTIVNRIINYYYFDNRDVPSLY